MRAGPIRLIAALLWASAATVAPARMLEEQFDLPVKVTDAYGKTIEQPIKVTLFIDDARPAPRPLLVLTHGRAPEAEARAALGRARYSDNARWLAARGFAVAVPTRIGYGVSGGPDVEDTGPCEKKRYPPGYAAAAQQVVAVLQALRQRPDIAPDRIVVAGQSYGGATAITVASQNPPGVVAVINFAGGGGGNPKTQPGRPCAPHQLERMFGDYGATARLPTLWIYTENDLFLGAEGPRDWFAAFKKAGGTGEFTQFPPHGDDGHGLFTSAPATWRPLVSDFLRRQGFDIKE
jgi:dienelactone hydrolase